MTAMIYGKSAYKYTQARVIYNRLSNPADILKIGQVYCTVCQHYTLLCILSKNTHWQGWYIHVHAYTVT